MRRLFLRFSALIPLLLLSLLSVQGRNVPRPEDVFGFRPGTDYKLAAYNQMLEYYRQLDESSERVKVFEIGPTTEGRPMILAVISSEANMAELEKYRAISEKLARARVSEAEALQLASIGKAVVWIDGGLHASEVGHAQLSPELAYRVATDESDSMRTVRDNVIFLQMPVMNPDGLDLIVDWYRRNLGTKFETSPLPELYHKYAGHDNNRDWYMITQPETKNVSRLLYEVWYPQVVQNHHQTPPFPARIFIPPFTAPVNPNIHPLVLEGIDKFGDALQRRFQAEGKTGVVRRMEFDAWWNGGMRTTPCFHNMIGILTETALYNYATPYYYKPENIPHRFKNGLPAREASDDYPQPWKGGHWRLRDAIDYMMTSSLGVLQTGAENRERILLNIYRMGRQAIEGANDREGVRAYLVPPSQHDPSTAAALIESLRRAGIEIEQAVRPFKAGGRDYPAGTFIITTAQAFRAHLVDLMEPQRYPAGGGQTPSTRPYDMTGWTLTLQMGVQVVRVKEQLLADTVRVDRPVVSGVASSGFESLSSRPVSSPVLATGTFVIDRRWNSSVILVNHLLAAGVPVECYTSSLKVDGEELPPGAFLVDARYQSEVERLSQPLQLPVRTLSNRPHGDLFQRIRQPRVGIHKSYVANADEGWTRWILEQYGFNYRSLSDSEIRAGRLREKYDVLILPSASATHMIQGYSTNLMPPEFARGLGREGVEELKAFAEEGGTLVATDGACALPIGFFDIPLKNPIARLSESDFYSPGALVRLQVDTSDPLGFGMTSEAIGCFAESQAFELPGSAGKASDQVHTIVRYADRDLLASGWMLGDDRIAGKPAVVRIKLGAGQLVLLGFRPHFRAQSHGTFKLLFNSIYLSSSEWSPAENMADSSQAGGQ